MSKTGRPFGQSKHIHFEATSIETKMQAIDKLPAGTTLAQALNICLNAIGKGTLVIPKPEQRLPYLSKKQ